MQFENPLDVIFPLDHVDVALLAHADLVAHGGDARRLPAGECAQRQVVETAVGQAEALVCGSALCEASERWLTLGTGYSTDQAPL